ncbi:hypothetical protein COB55_04305 [Candidatus Wolfebacteria bacterium]|nr:MAG: hypothetical protein COB55_04305 [Candidatus Wolfebacteria bacterium]
MPQVQFNDEYGYGRSRLALAENKSKMHAWLFKVGLAKNSKTANNILVGVAIVTSILAVIIFSSHIDGRDPPFHEPIPIDQYDLSP